MAKRYNAEEAAHLIMQQDDMGETDSADSLDEDWSSDDAESTSESEIASDEDEESTYCGRKILQLPLQMRRRVRGGGSNVRRRGRGIRTRGGSLAAQGKRKRYNHEQSPDEQSADEQSADEQSADEQCSGQGNDSINEEDQPARRTDEDGGAKSDPASEWSNNEPVIKTFPFNENPGLKINYPNNDDPCFFFNLFLTDQLLQDLVQRSNSYAESVINSSRPLRRNSILNLWKPITIEEIKKFFGLVFHMGLVAMPTYRSYWSKDRLYQNELFKSVMSRDRFQSIMRFLHFGEELNFQDDRLSKIRFLLNHLNNRIAEIYTPHKDLSLDESMMLWRGRLVFRQYIKNKRHKYGVKFFELCTNDGMVVRADIYSGIKFADPESLGQTAAVVLHLMQNYLDKGYHIFADNWYNSVPLTKYLTKRKTYITGTLRADRKDTPRDVMQKKLKAGEMVSQSLDDISVTKWKDKRDVRIISNAHIPQFVESVNRNGKSKQKPNVVHIYNQNMSGIDRSDQMLSYHSGLRKTIRWYKKVGIHIMEIFIANAFYLYTKNTRSPQGRIYT